MSDSLLAQLDAREAEREAMETASQGITDYQAQCYAAKLTKARAVLARIPFVTAEGMAYQLTMSLSEATALLAQAKGVQRV